jgi:hemolysin D
MKLPLIKRIIDRLNSLENPNAFSIYTEKPDRVSASSLIWILLFTTCAVIIWPALVTTDEVLTVEGKLETLSKTNPVASAQSGLIEEIKVIDGGLVRKDSIIFQLDNTQAVDFVTNSKQQLISAQMQYDLLKAGSVLSQQAQNRYMDELRAQLDADRQVLAAYRQIYSFGAGSRLSVVTQEAKVKAQEAELLRQNAEFAKLVSDNNSKLASAQAQISQTKSELIAHQISLNQLSIRSPIDGFIYDIQPTGVYYPVSPGTVLARVVPLDDLKAVVCLPISRTDDFHRNQEVSITVQALNILKSGAIPGYIDYISADVVEAQEGKGRPCFKCYINLSVQTPSTPDGKPIHLRPGQGISAAIKLRKTSYFELFFDSLFNKKANP